MNALQFRLCMYCNVNACHVTMECVCWPVNTLSVVQALGTT